MHDFSFIPEPLRKLMGLDHDQIEPVHDQVPDNFIKIRVKCDRCGKVLTARMKIGDLEAAIDKKNLENLKIR